MNSRTVEGQVFRAIFKKAYTTLPSHELETKAYDRSQAKPGFPYLSFKQAEALKLSYALKLAERKNIEAAIFAGEQRTASDTIASTNRRLKDLVNKGFLEVYKMGKSASHWYALTEQSFQYLRRRPYNTEFDSHRMLRIHAVNQRFTQLCNAYRETHVIDWETEPVVPVYEEKGEWTPTAVAVIWEDRAKTNAVEAHIYETLENVYLEDQLLEVERLKAKYTNTTMWKYFPVMPDVVLVHQDTYEELKLMENKEVVASQSEIEKWLGL